MEIEHIIEVLNFSNITWKILAPILFMLADIITGFIQAVINKKVDSSVMRTGLLHKIMLIVIIFLSYILDLSFNLSYISRIVSVYIIIMELTSILENINKSGINIGKLTEILKRKEE